MNYVQVLGITFVILLGLAMNAIVLPQILLVSFRRRLFDVVDDRKIHSGLVPRFGGFAFFPCITVTVSLAIVGQNMWFGRNVLDMAVTNHWLSTCSSLFLLYLVGVMDDLVGVRYRSKFIAQAIAGLILAASGIWFNNLYGFLGIHELPIYVGVPLTVFAVVFILNAINMIDGIDGLASGLSIIAFIVMGCVFACLHWWVCAYVCFATFGTLLPFFFRNVFGDASRGRKLFMGDTGSLTIGMLLAVMVIRLSMFDAVKERIFPESIVVAFSLLLVPVFDVLRVTLHRLRCGKNPFVADKNHIHHKFLALGMHQHVVLVIILGIAIAFIAMNMLLLPILSITTIFFIDLAVWTLMHMGLTMAINKKNKLKEINPPETKK